MYKRITTNCIAAKFFQQNNFGVGKFPDQPFCVGLGTRLLLTYLPTVSTWREGMGLSYCGKLY